MKKLLLFVAVLFVMQSCSKKKEIYIINTASHDTIRIESKKDMVIIDKSNVDKMSRLRQPLKDVAYYFLTHKDDWSNDRFEFKCGKFSFWKCNGLPAYELTAPKKISLNAPERQYFYDLYQTHKHGEAKRNDRLYRYEDKFTIVVK